jgi:hypothetical protein
VDIGITFMGILVGCLVGMTGVGGASLLTPVLVLVGIQPSVAVGTDLFYNSVTKLFGTVQHFRQKTIDFRLVGHLAAGSVPGAVAAVAMLQWFDTFFHNQEHLIRQSLGAVLIAVSLTTLARQLFRRNARENRWQAVPLAQKRAATVLIGAALGFIVGLTSIGSGSLFAIALMHLYRLTAAQLVGTDIAHAFLLVTAAGLMHAGFGNVDFLLAFNLLIGSVPGVLLGGALAPKVPAGPLRAVVAALILISGVKLL